MCQLMGKHEKIAFLNRFIYTNFNYCPLVWRFSTCESIKETEKIQKLCLGIALEDYESNNDILLRKIGKLTRKKKRLRVLATDVFETVSNLIPNNIKDIFNPKLHPQLRPNNILVKHHNTITYDTKRVKTLGKTINI